MDRAHAVGCPALRYQGECGCPRRRTKMPSVFNPHIPKAELKVGAYYEGRCRNAHIARWDGQHFWYWRHKFGNMFLEQINHPDDYEGFDVFVPERFLFDEEGIPFTGA